MFSTLPKTNFNFSVTFILSSASDFNLDRSKNLTFGKGLKLSKMAISVAQMVKFDFDWEINIVEKEENAGSPAFSPFPTVLKWLV